MNWLLSSPSLLESELNLDTGRFSLPADFHAEPVENFRAGSCSHRVGYYLESLVQTLLENDEAVGDLRRGIQIRENGKTLGEIDFLYRHNGVLHHLEVALKYYLYSPDVVIHGSRLPGPNAGDTFERKRDRLFMKQIPLGRERFPEIRHSHLLVKGSIFYPWHSEGISIKTEGLSRGHHRGIWVTDGQVESFLSSLPPVSGGAVLEKPFWLSGKMGSDRICHSPSALLGEIVRVRRESRRPVFFSVGTDKSGLWNESHRVFVVGNDWPSPHQSDPHE